MRVRHVRDISMTEHTWHTSSAEETIEAGAEIAALLRPQLLLILRGGLGAGKTTLVKGIAQALHAAQADEVTSPTFTLLHEYEGAQAGKAIALFHLDVYRLETDRQLASLGWEELLRPDAIVLIEWGEKFAASQQRADGEIAVEPSSDEGRTITLRMRGPGAAPAGS